MKGNGLNSADIGGLNKFIKDEFKNNELGTGTQAEDFVNIHPAHALTTPQPGDYLQVNLSDLNIGDQPRQHFDSARLEELSVAIKAKGVLQPVLIRLDENEEPWLIAGERRVKASIMAGLTEIPTIITQGDPAEIALIENIQRENLTPIEEADAYKKIIETHKYTQEQLAKIVGKGQSTIAEFLTINRLPEAIKLDYRTSDKPVNKSLLIEIAKQVDQQNQTGISVLDLWEQAKEGKLTNKVIRKLTRPKPEKKIPAEKLRKKAGDLVREIERADPMQFQKEVMNDILTSLQSTVNQTQEIFEDKPIADAQEIEVDKDFSEAPIPDSIPGMDSESTFFLVDVKNIRSSLSAQSLSQQDKAKIKKLADSIVECGLLRPLVLQATGVEKYLVISGDLEYHAAVKAREKDPRKCEMIESFVIGSKHKEKVLKQLEILESLKW